MPILFDLDGVFYQGNKPVNGAAEVARWIKANNIAHLFITNTTSCPRSELVHKLAGFGIDTTEDHIMTPVVAMLHWLKLHPPKQKIALFLADSTRGEFSEFSLQQNEADPVSEIIIGDLGENWSFNKLNQAFRLLMQQPAPNFFALGMARYSLAEDGLRLDVAPFIVALEYATGLHAQVMGKPEKSFFKSAVEILASTAEQTIMIGDDIQGDINAAQNAGLHGILVKTGKFLPGDLSKGIQPLAVLDSINNLPDWWEKSSFKSSGS